MDYKDTENLEKTEFPSLTYGYPVMQPQVITSTFGPRWKNSENRFDFHRGVDFYGMRGEPVFSVGAGEVFRVFHEGSKAYPNGGNTLLIRYLLEAPFQYHGQKIDRFFGVFLHLDEFWVKPGEKVERGQPVGAMGSSGNTRFIHLHFEVRLQTTCSLEYQLRHPQAVCARYGFDPHVHPFLFFGGMGAGKVQLSHGVGEKGGFWVLYEGTRNDLDLNGIETNRGEIDFNSRKGLDPSTTQALDGEDLGWVRIRPEQYSARTGVIRYLFEFPEKPKYIALKNIHGKNICRTFNF